MRVLTLSLFATILSAPAFAADLGTYRPGAPYHSIVAPGADVCDSQCAGDAQCRGWNYVKRSPQAPGICEFMSSVAAPIASPISISGQNLNAAPYSPRLTQGNTNTIRVGTQVSRNTNTTRVGQSPSGRRIVRKAPTQRINAQRTSTRPVENLSLTEQQNRFRQGFAAAPQAAVPAPVRQYVPQVAVAPRPAAPQRPLFRQHLDSSHQAPQIQHPQFQNPQVQQPQAQQPQRQSSRRATGPRRSIAKPTPQVPASNTPQFQAPQFQTPQFQAPQTQSPSAQQSFAQQPALPRGSSRPPVGQPIPPSPIPASPAPVNQQAIAPALVQPPARPQPPVRSTPSQRLAQFTAQSRAAGTSTPPAGGAISLSPEQAKQSLFGRLNDDVQLPVATSVPTSPVVQQDLDDLLAGGR